jgi:hypothetical protein
MGACRTRADSQRRRLRRNLTSSSLALESRLTRHPACRELRSLRVRCARRYVTRFPSSVDDELNEKVSRRLRDVRTEQFLELTTKRGTIPARIVVDAIGWSAARF